MKNFAIVLVLLVSVLFSCQKENLESFVDTEAIRSQLKAVPVPSNEEIQAGYSATQKLKSGELTLVKIFALDEKEYQIFTDKAIKPIVVYEVNNRGEVVKFFTVYQEFLVKNGVIDTKIYSMSFAVGCPMSKFFQITDENDIVRITYYFRGENGDQFAFYGEHRSSMVKLPPLAGGKWQIEVTYDDGFVRQVYMSELIDFYNSDTIRLKFEMKKENTVSYVEMNKNFIKGKYIIQLSGYDKDGNYLYQSYPLAFDQELAETIYFPAPFDVVEVLICGLDGCWSYSTSNMGISTRGDKKSYVVK